MQSFARRIFFISVVALGWLAVTPRAASAYYPPQCVNSGGHKYCLSNYYNATYCIHKKYHSQAYIYCRSASSGGGVGSGY